jgi:ketosteroid isomerase-like protein
MVEILLGHTVGARRFPALQVAGTSRVGERPTDRGPPASGWLRCRPEYGRTTKARRPETAVKEVLEMPRGPDPWGRRLKGREAVRSGLASRFAGIPDVHYGDDRHWVSGDRGCSEWLLTGATTQGEPVVVRGCDLFEFRGDKIARKDSYWKLVDR